MIFSMIKKQWSSIDDVPILTKIRWISNNVWKYIIRIKVNKKIGHYRVVTYGVGKDPEIQIYHDDICIAVFDNTPSADPKSGINFPNVVLLSGSDNAWKIEQENVIRLEYKAQCRPYKIPESFNKEIGKEYKKG